MTLCSVTIEKASHIEFASSYIHWLEANLESFAAYQAMLF